MISKVKKVAAYILLCILLMAMVLYHIDDNILPKIFGDEYGYWAAGAYFAGLDWKEITSLNDYYGWGYGLLLSVILRLPISAQECYQLAIGLNGVFLCAIYIIALKLSKKIIQCNNDIINVVAAFAVTLMPSTLYYTQYTMSEVILAFCYWSIVYLAWKIVNENVLIYEVLFIITNVFMLSIHMRTIGIVLISVILLLFVHIRKNKVEFKRIIINITILLALIFLISVIKGTYRDSYTNSLIILKTGNDIAGQVGKIQYLFTFEGISSFLKLFIGRLYSMGNNTFLLAIGAIILGILCSVRAIKNKKQLEANEIIVLFASLSTLSEIAISSISMIGPVQGRFDILTYARYHEFTIGVLVLFGLEYTYCILKRIDKIQYVLVPVLILILLGLIVTTNQEYETPLRNCFINIPILFYWINHNIEIKDVFLLAIMYSILLYAIYMMISLHNGKVGTLAICSAIIIFTIMSNNYTYTNGCLNWSIQESDNILKIEKFIKQNHYEDKLCFIVDDDVLYVDRLQFALKDNTIHIISNEQISEQDNRIIVTSKGYDENILINDNYELLFDGIQIKLWERVVNGKN